eukprot:gene20288-26336_t
MVCDSCLPKLSKVIIPDKWKEGSRNNSKPGGAVKAGKTNKILEKSKADSQWIPKEHKCRICYSKVTAQLNYCNDCAHKKGICAMCGKKAVDVSNHRMTLV